MRSPAAAAQEIRLATVADVPLMVEKAVGSIVSELAPIGNEGVAVVSLVYWFMPLPARSAGHACVPYRASAVGRVRRSRSAGRMGAGSCALRHAPDKSVALTRHS